MAKKKVAPKNQHDHDPLGPGEYGMAQSEQDLHDEAHWRDIAHGHGRVGGGHNLPTAALAVAGYVPNPYLDANRVGGGFDLSDAEGEYGEPVDPPVDTSRPAHGGYNESGNPK